MKNFAFVARSHIRNVVLCGLLTVGLAACGADGSSSSSGASVASDSNSSVVAPNVGVIARNAPASGSASVPTTATSATSATSGTTTRVATPAPAPAATGSSGTTVASANKSTLPVKSSTGTATLDWMPPTENSDGTVLTDLAGYTVYYGTSPGNLTQSVKVANPGLTAYTMTNLPSGTWYFAVTAYSATGVESARSGVASTTI